MENQNFITGNKIGNRVNLTVNGQMYSKNFPEGDFAKEFFSEVLETKKNPTDENVNTLLEKLNKRLFISKVDGFVLDVETNKVFMEGFEHTEVPELLLKTIMDYIENGFDMKAIKNFWKLLMANPDPQVRKDLFDFIAVHDFSLTDEGYMWVYKKVTHMNKIELDLASFVSNQYIHVRKNWKCSAKKYVVYKQFHDEEKEDFTFNITKEVTANSWDLEEKNVEIVGNLDDLQSRIDELIDADTSTVFTDLHTRTMKITLGTPVTKSREDCDGNPKRDCSYGLHVGATRYVENFYKGGDRTVLVCLVNPMNVVAVPDYDHSKMRVCEYFPVGVATYEDGKIDIIQQSFLPYDYIAHEEEQLKEMLEENFRGVPTALNAQDDDRKEEEYMSILKSRVTDLSTMSNDN